MSKVSERKGDEKKNVQVKHLSHICNVSVMTSFSREKKSQHAFIQGVIIRKSFLSATCRVLSTRAVGVCPWCDYFKQR